MKKWFFRLVGISTAVFGVIVIVILIGEMDKTVAEKYVKNENLPTVKTDWRGTPVDEKGRFVNAEFPFLPSTIELLKWQLGTNPQKEEKRNDDFQLKVQDPTDFLKSEKDGILWLGHASILIRLNKKVILLDPVFGDPSFIKRFTEVPSPLPSIERIDYVLITHDHRDHCDENTIRQIAQKFPNAKFLVGLEMENLIKDWITPSNEMQTAGWYQQFSTPENDLKIFFLPARHWSRRALFDTNERLWGAFLIQSAQTTIYHGGDSGYGIQYKELAEVFPEIDYFIIGIGAYAPRWFMEPNHNNPDDAFQAFQDSGAKKLVPMHYGTFDLSDEPPSEPLRLLKEKAAAMNLSDKIEPLNINQSIEIE